MPSTHARALVVSCVVALVSLVGLAPAVSAPAGAASASVPAAQQSGDTTTDEPQGYLVAKEDLPDLDTLVDTTVAGSIVVSRGRETVRVGKDLGLGLVIHFKDGGPVTYGTQEKVNGKWVDAVYTTKGDPADGCAMGGPGWPTNAPGFPGKIRVRGFALQDGERLVTPAYTVTVKAKK